MDTVVIIVGLLVGAQGFWSFLNAITNRRGPKAEMARQEAVVEIDKERAKTDSANAEVQREKLLAESRLAMQQATLDGWKESYDRLHTDFEESERKEDACREDFIVLHQDATSWIDVFARFLAKMRDAADNSTDVLTIKVTGPEFIELRKTITEARMKLR